MIDLDAFLPEINPKAPGVPAPAAYVAIRAACDELCTRTRQWRYSDEIAVQDVNEIDLSFPDQSALVDFESVLFNDRPLEPKTAAWMDQCMRGWRRGAIEGQPRFFSQLDIGTLRVAPVDTGILTVNSILKPSMDADQVPDFLFTLYHEVIAWGALGRLLATPDQPFTNVDMAGSYLTMFTQKLDSLAWKGTTGQQRAPLRSRGQYM
jgi:hypothetical protein